MADIETYDDVIYKGEKGKLVLSDMVFHYTANGSSKTSVKCSWARVEKRQLSPIGSPIHMMKLILISGKTAVFEVARRELLDDLRMDAQARMDMAQQRSTANAMRDSSRRQSMGGIGGGSNHMRDSSRRHSMNHPSMRDSSRRQSITGAGGAAGANTMRDSSRRQSMTDGTTRGFDDPTMRSDRDWVDEPITSNSSKRRTSSTIVRRKSTTSGSKNGDACGNCGCCCCGNLICWLCFVIICILLAVAVALIYWFVIKDNQDTIITTFGGLGNNNNNGPEDLNKAPDDGNEARYGIRSVYHKWDEESVTLDYRISDYILDNSISYRLYDGLDCRRSSNDITSSNRYLFMELNLPRDGGATDLYNDGRGSRDMNMRFTLNQGEITDAPFFTASGLEKGQLNFCVGLIINYNKVEHWSREEEVNAVEVAIQMDIDMSDFRRIQQTTVKTIIRPKYNRRLR